MQVRALSEQRADMRAPTKHESLVELVGRTPLVRLGTVTAELADGVEVWAKLEFFNPGGSIKDRVAAQIIEAALAEGVLAGRRLLDASCGNTGISYAMLGAALGIGVTIVLPQNVPTARVQMIQCYGGEIIYSSPLEGTKGAIELAQAIADEHPDQFWFANQHSNPSNARAHELHTAPEIWAQTDGRVSHFVAGAGTGGTLAGVGRSLKAQNPNVQVLATRPSQRGHGLWGLELDETGSPEIADGVVLCDPDEARAMAARLAHSEGIATGRTGAANVWAAVEVASDLETGVVVTVICDHADRWDDT